MNNTLNFEYGDAVLPVIIAAIALYAVFLFKEWDRKGKRFFVRALVGLITLVALVFLILRPLGPDLGMEAKGVLLTDGYRPEILDSLRKRHKNIREFQYAANASMKEVLDSISSLYILGNGVRTYDFWQFKDVPTRFLNAGEPNGIIRLDFDRQPRVGDEWVIRGAYRTSESNHRLVLTDPGGTPLDSIRIDTAGLSHFRLATDLKASGRYRYHLQVKDASGVTLANERIPVQVRPKKALRFLMMLSFPTFDSKYLKNFLAEAGNALTVRNQLSRGKYKFEYFNTPRLPFNALSKKLLDSQDVLLIDAVAWANLSRSSRRTVENAVKHDGLGLLILPNEGFFKGPNDFGFEFVRAAGTKTSLAQWPEIMVTKYPFRIQNSMGLQTIHRSDGKMLTAYVKNGKGRIGTTVVMNSYELVLQGNQRVYREFWTDLLTAIARRNQPLLEWDPSGWLTYTNEPFKFTVRTSVDNPSIYGENGRIALARHVDIKEHYNGTTYPREEGWNKLQSSSDSLSVLNFYVMDSLQWKSVRAFNTQMSNERQFSDNQLPFPKKMVLRPIHQAWFFLIGLIGLGYLWLAPKLEHDQNALPN